MSTVTDTWLDAHRIDPTWLAEAPLIGIDHVEDEVASLVARLADPAKAERLGAEIPRSVLLHGRPGIGKTHTARALARRLGGLPVYEVGADELSAPVVRALFTALGGRHERSLLVIDEIDLVGGDRSEADADARRTLAALLTALDGLQTAAGILVIAATSQATWDLDPALLRAGRLGFIIEIAPPDEPTRRDLLAHFLTGRPLAADVNLAPLAAMTRGSTPADPRAACVDAAGIAVAGGHDTIEQGDLVAAFERAGRVVPAPDPGPVNAAALWRVCVHEAGHVLAGSVVHGVASIWEVAIGPASGSVSIGPGREPDETLDEANAAHAITSLFAGFVAERVVFGAASLAHTDDIEAATDVARRIVEGGLDPSMPPIDIGLRWINGTSIADRVVTAVAAHLSAGRERAVGIVLRYAPLVTVIAERLREEALPELAADPHRAPVQIDIERLRVDVTRWLQTADRLADQGSRSASPNGQDVLAEDPLRPTAARSN